MQVGAAVGIKRIVGRDPRIAQIDPERRVGVDRVLNHLDLDARVVSGEVWNIDAVPSVARNHVIDNRMTDGPFVHKDAVAKVADAVVAGHVGANVVILYCDAGRAALGVDANGDPMAAVC